MLLKPSQSLNAIEHSRTIVIDRIERIRSVYAAIQEYGITKEDYQDTNDKPEKKDILSSHPTLLTETDSVSANINASVESDSIVLRHLKEELDKQYPKNFSKVPDNDSVSYGNISFWEKHVTLDFLVGCEKEIKLLKVFNQQSLRLKPKEETIASVKQRLINYSKYFTRVTLFFTMDLDKELAACNIKINKFKKVCETMVKYKVSDADYIKIYSKHEGYMHNNPDLYPLCSQISMRQKELDEALDLVGVIEASYKDYKPYAKKWIFRIPALIDKNLKELLNGLLERYARIVDI